MLPHFTSINHEPGVMRRILLTVAWAAALSSVSLAANPKSEGLKQQAGQQSARNDDTSILPFVSTDEVIRRHAETGTNVRLTGVIQNLSGDILEIRRGGAGKIEAIRLRDVVELRFRKPAEYDTGLSAMKKGEWQKAISLFMTAEETEQRTWVDRELMSCRARCLLALNKREDVIPLIEQILETDPASRHVALLPLVWDEQLPESERINISPSALSSNSLPRKLTAASALLNNPQHEAAALVELHAIRLCGIKRFQELAEVQLWRIRILHPDRLRKVDVELWAGRTPDLERQIRGPAEFLLGRAYLQQHEYDQAVRSFLWLPLMHPDDRALAASSLLMAAKAMKVSGRPLESDQLMNELLENYSETSTARQFNVKALEPGP